MFLKKKKNYITVVLNNPLHTFFYFQSLLVNIGACKMHQWYNHVFYVLFLS